MSFLACGPTAFQYYRIPPQILGLYPAILPPEHDHRLVHYSKQPVFDDLLGKPVWRFVSTRGARFNGKLFHSRLLTQEPPPGSFRQTEHGFDVTSPEFTLLSLATHVSPNQLLMACYELCGSFAVFKPSKRAQQQLDEAISLQLIAPSYGWERVKDVNGNDTNLWKRTPLLNAADIAAFAKQAAGMRGVKQLRWAAERMTGQTASPFEVQASMLISLPRVEGGLGMSIANNVRIPLSEAARSLYTRSCCYADILIESNTDSMGVILECQGRSAHGSEPASISDAERTTALTSMGYDVIQITYDQIKDKKSFEYLAELIHKKAGLPYTPKTKQEADAEDTLRRELLVDWDELFSVRPTS